jgi:hypothetical protein
MHRLASMLPAVLLTLALAAPATSGPPLQPDRWELGRLQIEQSTTLTWPGLYLPAFTLAPDRRNVHRLTLGLDLPALRGLSFDAVVVEPSGDPNIRARTAGLPTGEGSRAYAWVGLRYRIPGSRWQLGVGHASVLRVASAVARTAMGRGSGWSVNLLRPLR